MTKPVASFIREIKTTFDSLRTLSSIHDRCEIQDDHWLWTGRMRYGAPRMTYCGETMAVRSVVALIVLPEFRLGMRLRPACGHANCVSPACVCICTTTLVEYRMRSCYRDSSGRFRRIVQSAATPQSPTIAPMWAQLVRQS